MTLRIAAAAALLSMAKGFSRSVRYFRILFWCWIASRWRVGSIRVLGCDSQERAADDFGPVRILFELDQRLAQILCGSRLREIVPKSLIAVGEVREHESILAFEVPIKRRLCDVGDGHDLFGAGRADPLGVEEPVSYLKKSASRIGLLL